MNIGGKMGYEHRNLPRQCVPDPDINLATIHTWKTIKGELAHIKWHWVAEQQQVVYESIQPLMAGDALRLQPSKTQQVPAETAAATATEPMLGK